ncbi:DUF4062 domain-containing protein [Streptomyces sp. NPDC047042]|uniref:DUF4062 domain-containing protein n=1 Tax=Streptomyces sp. NPDC047042 TaxID=3154807 RepID=UPI0033E0572B
MTETFRQVRVFISSTFRDMHAERDHLVAAVFPELRERLDRLGLEFYDVDLRWGVPETGWDGERANPWQYCRRWIDLVEPFFICMIGQRYGHVLTSSEIGEQEGPQAYEGMSITELEVRHAVLDGRLRRRSFFYVRSSRVPETAPANIYAEYVSRAQQSHLVSFMERVESSGRPVRRYEGTWTGSGFSSLDGFGRTVLEDLWSGVLRDERYVAKETWRRVLGHDPEHDSYYTDDSHPIPEYLWTQLVEAARPRALDPLDAEAREMARYASGRLRGFTGRADQLHLLANFVDIDQSVGESRVCVVQAPAGQGKSALLAKLAENLAATRHYVVSHFVGATEQSADVRSMLARLNGELDRVEIPDPAPVGPAAGREALSRSLAERLGAYESEKHIVLLLDAVDQLADGQDLAWLPHQLGDGVRVVLTYADTEPSDGATTPLAAARRARRTQFRQVELPGLTEQDVRVIVVAYLEEYCKELESAEIDAICQLEQARNPLYLLVMLNELRALSGNDMQRVVRSVIAELPRLRPDAVSLFEWRLESLERAFGTDRVRQWCSYICAGRTGMSSTELRELVVTGEEGQDASVVPLIERGIRQYLRPRGGELDFFHTQLEQAVKKRYLDTNAAYVESHVAIASYFRRKADPQGTGEWKGGHERALSELPYHLAEGGKLDDLFGVLTDFQFLERKAAEVGVVEHVDDGGVVTRTHTGVFALQDDLDLAIAKFADIKVRGTHPLIVTAFNTGKELAVRCPRCAAICSRETQQLGMEMLCPHCNGPLKVNPSPVRIRGGLGHAEDVGYE